MSTPCFVPPCQVKSVCECNLHTATEDHRKQASPLTSLSRRCRWSTDRSRAAQDRGRAGRGRELPFRHPSSPGRHCGGCHCPIWLTPYDRQRHGSAGQEQRLADCHGSQACLPGRQCGDPGNCVAGHQLRAPTPQGTDHSGLMAIQKTRHRVAA